MARRAACLTLVQLDTLRLQIRDAEEALQKRRAATPALTTKPNFSIKKLTSPPALTCMTQAAGVRQRAAAAGRHRACQ